MILTDDFVALNNPKTGSTFVRTILKTLYEDPGNYTLLQKLQLTMGIKKPLLTELILPSNRNFKRKRNQHGAYSQIPASHANKPVFSVVRNPYEKYLAAYEYRYWAKNPILTRESLEKHFPRFPNLSIDEFIDMAILVDQEFSINDKGFIIGTQTEQFIYMFFKEPKKVLKHMDADYFESKAFLEDMGKIDFLTQENLNTELTNYLSRYGFSSRELEIISKHEKVNENKNRQEDKKALLTPKFIDYLNHNEKYFFLMLKELGINYANPLEEA